MAFVILLLIIVGEFFYYDRRLENQKSENSKLKKQIKALNEEIKRLKEGTVVYEEAKPVENTIVKEAVKEPKVSEKLAPEKVEDYKVSERQYASEETKQKEREQNNTGILITGAVLIVLAAIVFLMSTWTVLPDILKTGVLMLVAVVFFGLSNVARDKYKLDKASNAFFYIGMAYIPICLISISIFGLMGRYLSIYGEGRYIYLTGVGLVTSAIYYVFYNARKNRTLLYGSIISQISTVVLFSLIFENEEIILIAGLLIYNIVLTLLGVYRKEEKIKFIEMISYAIPYFCGVTMLSVIYRPEYDLLIDLILLSINFILIYSCNKKNTFNAWLFNATVHIVGLYLIFKVLGNLQMDLKIILAVVYAIMIFIVEEIFVIGDKSLRKSSMVSSMVSVGYTFCVAQLTQLEYLKPYMVAIVEELLMIAAYARSEKTTRVILSYIIPIILTGIAAMVYSGTNYLVYLSIPIVVFIIGQFFRSTEYKEIATGSFYVSHVLILVGTLLAYTFNNEAMHNDALYFVVVMLVYAYSYLRTKNPLFKNAGYVAGMITLATCAVLLNIESKFLCLIPAIATIAIIIFENRYTKFKDAYSLVAMFVFELVSYYELSVVSMEAAAVVGLILAAVVYYYNIKNKELFLFRIAPMIGLVPMFMYSGLDETFVLVYRFVVVIGCMIPTIMERKITIDSIYSGFVLYLISDETFDSLYVTSMLGIIWSTVNLIFIENNSHKDIFKAIIYILVYILYGQVLKDLKLTDYTAFSSIGLLILMTMMSRDILVKYIKDIEPIEYVVFGIFYLYTISIYTSITDGMIFVGLVIAYLMYTYYKGYGSLFIISLIAILVNAFGLTKEFWFMVPWWIYLGIAGFVLITFAAKNESDTNKNKSILENKIKKLKENIDQNGKEKVRTSSNTKKEE